MPRRRLPFLTAVLCGAALCAQTPTDKLRFDSTGSVTQRRILPPEPQETDWHDLHRAYFYPHGREEDYGEDK